MTAPRPVRTTVTAGLLALLTGVTACGELPRPFAHGAESRPLARLDTAAGVAVLPPEGVAPPLAAAAADALAAALRDHGQPAQALDEEAATRLNGYVIRGSLEGDTLIWDLLSPEGRRLRQSHQDAPDSPDAQAWSALSSAAVPDLAQAIERDAQAPLVARMALTRRAPLPDDSAPAAPPRPTSTRPSVTLAPIDGLPDDRARLLTAALTTQLQARGIDVSDDAPVTVAGQIELGEETPAGLPLRVTWRVLDDFGQETGSADQANTVPARLWADRFPAFAGAIAQGAADGVLAILKRATRR